jgi:hypothetical protein
MAIFPATAIPSGASDFTLDQSLKFDGSSSRLNFTAGTPTNALIYTWSFWAKRGNIGSYQQMFAAGPVRGGGDVIRFSSNDGLYVSFDDGNSGQLETTAKFRDPSAWYNIVVAVDTTQSTDTNRVKIYVNGVQYTSFGIETFPAEDYDTPAFNTSGKTFNIGRGHPDEQYFDGYLAEFHFIDGTQLTPTSFGETGDYGEWKPIKVSGLTYGNNGFYLDFADAADMGDDESGNTNDFTETNIAAADQMVDSPTNNFATLNPIDNYGAKPLSEGNLKCSGDVSSCYNTGTFWFETGKWYFEALCTAIGTGSGDGFRIGFANTPCRSGRTSSSNIAWTLAYLADSKAWDGETELSGAATYGVNDIVAMAIDLDAGTPTLKMYKNNVLQITRNISAAFQDVPLSPFMGDQEAGTIGGVMNFGSDSSFAGGKTAQGNQDDNDIGDFYYTPPSGYLALCTSNLPAVAVTPSENFTAKLYTGNASDSSTTQVVTTDIQPDFVWMKCRSNDTSHRLQDIVRGVNSSLYSDTAGAETDQTGSDITTFGTTSFTLTGNGAGTNRSGRTYVAWNWKAGGGTILGTGDFTQGTIASTCSRNVDAGFSIVSYTGTGSAGNVGHGLSQKPDLTIFKDRDVSIAWGVEGEIIGSSNPDGLRLSSTEAKQSESGNFNNATATLLNFPNDWAVVNNSGSAYIAYCFHSVDGYSKVGTYTGNNAADGTFVYTGFRPAWILFKRTDSTSSWTILDSARDTDNPINGHLRAQTSDVEFTTDPVSIADFTSNGFKLRTATDANDWNAAGDYLYLAFAETPFKYSNAR